MKSLDTQGGECWAHPEVKPGQPLIVEAQPPLMAKVRFIRTLMRINHSSKRCLLRTYYVPRGRTESREKQRFSICFHKAKEKIIKERG